MSKVREMSPDTTVEETLDRFTCPRCGAFSHHVRGTLELRSTHNKSTFGRSFTDESDAFVVSGSMIAGSGASFPVWTATICASCSAPSIWRYGQLIYPRNSMAPSPHPDMPEAARELFEEARLVLGDSRRAAAALARASLEALLKAQFPESKAKNLQGRIGELESRVNSSLWRVLTALRVVGNDSLHGDHDDLVVMYLSGDAAEVVEPFFGAINALVEELITQPRKADELYKLIPPAKREAAERAASAPTSSD